MKNLVRHPMRHVRRTLKKLKPRKRGSLEHYGTEFNDTAKAFAKFLKRCPVEPSTDTRPPVGVLVAPWVNTPTPWFAIALGIGLNEYGRRVVFIWDDVPFPTPGHDTALQNRAIARILDSLRDKFEIVQLSTEQPQPAHADDDPVIRQLTDQNLIWYSRGKKIGMVDSPEGQAIASSLNKTLGLMRGVLARKEFDYLVIPTGKTLTGGIYKFAGNQANLRAATYDAGLQVIFISTDGIAAQQQDIPRAVAEMEKADAATMDAMLSKARQEFHLRREGRDRQNFQVTAPGQQIVFPKDAVLMPLSLEWDAASLGSHYLFENTIEWVLSTVDYCLKHSNHSVIVRQHPGERVKFGNSQLDIRARLQERFGNEPRLIFVGKNDHVNTYDLIARSLIVLPFVSTVSIEAAALGKPVLIAGKAYYANLGFVYSAKTRAEYFQFLELGLRGELALFAEQERKALLCYYATQICNFIWTDFTAQPPDFWKWVRQSPQELFQTPVFRDIVTSLEENVPIALLQHRRKVGTPALVSERSDEVKLQT